MRSIKKVPPGNPRQIRTNYRCSDQGLAGFACRTSTAPDSGGSQTHVELIRNDYFQEVASCIVLAMLDASVQEV